VATVGTTPTGGGGPGSIDSFFKIVKLVTAILPTVDTATATATATNMASLMSLSNQHNHHHHHHHHKPNTRGGPSDTLIKCFKIADLEMDESK